MSVQTFEQITAMGRVKQGSLLTASAAGDLIRFNKNNASLADPRLATETDEDEIGKGHEYAEESYATAWDVAGQFDKYLTSEAAAIFLAYVMGDASVVAGAGAGSYVHTIKMSDPVTAGIDMVPFTVLEQIRPGGGGAVIDRALIGCVMEDVVIAIGSGPSRAAAKITANYVGTGKFTDPSTITAPSKTVEHRLPASSLTLTINGTDYVGGKIIESVEVSIKNNVRTDSGYFPGSGFQTTGDADSGQIRGRMEHGKRQVTLKFTARFKAGSTEPAKLKAQTEGTASLSVQGGLIAGTTYHKLVITFPRIRFSNVAVNNADNIQTVDVECAVLYDATDGPMKAVVTNTLALVGGEEEA